VLANKTRRALDSTLLDDAVATQDTVTQLVSMIRRVRKAIPEAAAAVLVGDDYEVVNRPGFPGGSDYWFPTSCWSVFWAA
jgi:hypothetical protein